MSPRKKRHFETKTEANSEQKKSSNPALLLGLDDGTDVLNQPDFNALKRTNYSVLSSKKQDIS